VRAAILLFTFTAATSPHAQQAFDPARPDIAGFIADVAHRHEIEPASLTAVLAQAQSQPAILAAISRPAERTLGWDEYRAKFLIDKRIQRGAETYAIRRTALERAATSTGVPVDILLGIVGVETFYGDNTGRYRVVDALATLAFDYPPRSPYFTQELEQYLLMAREEKLDPLTPRGSYAGAMGIPQFMPTSFRRFAVDGDGDGTRDLWTDWDDVFASVGNYLREHGWRAGEPVMVPADASAAKLDGLDMTTLDMKETVGSLRRRGVRFQTTLADETPATLVPLAVGFGTEYRVGFANFVAITRYNRSLMYASAVSDLADAIAVARTTLPMPSNTPAVASATP
jgi:membrane-bound lytic murein transglycosylase B